MSQAVEEHDEAPAGGTLLPCPRLVPGQHFISIDLEKIGLKDADTYVDPLMSVSTYGRSGNGWTGTGNLARGDGALLQCFWGWGALTPQTAPVA